jgi:proteasome lid subunit RPN8/RPN11
MLEIDDDHYATLVAHAKAGYPNEACALLAGRDGSVERVYALPNAEASPTFYVVEPKGQLRAMTEMDDLGLDLVGIFHSHVATEAYPSRTDVELAAYPARCGTARARPLATGDVRPGRRPAPERRHPAPAPREPVPGGRDGR